MKRAWHKGLIALGLIAALHSAALAKEWYAPAHAGRSYVNPHLTSGRLKSRANPHWNGQLVLWEGTIQEQKNDASGCSFKLKNGDETVLVKCPAMPLTMHLDRSGCQAAVKGEVRLKDGKFDGLTGRSVILLGPPKPWPNSQKLDSFLAGWIQFHSPKYSTAQCTKIAQQIVAESEKNGLDPLFFASLLQIESAYKLDAVSCSGAVGLGQLMPATAEGLGVDPHDPMQNLTGSAKMLAGLLKNFPEQSDARPLALASYNAGPTLVRNLGAVPAIPQTTNYVYFIGYLHHRLQQVARAQGVSVAATP